MTSILSRRQLLAGACGAAAVSVGALGCSSDSPNSSTASKGSTTAPPSGPPTGAPGSSAGAPGTSTSPTKGRLTLPAYLPYTGVKPDGANSADGTVEPFFKTYPSSPPKLFGDTKPGSGGTVTSMVRLDSALQPPPVSKNPFWQQLNDRLGTNLNIQQTPNADYANKLAVIVAGDSFPDLMHIPFAQAPSNLANLLESKFEDLTDRISGEAIKQYPGLATIPPASWNAAVVNGRIYGVTLTYPVARHALYMRNDLLAKLDINANFANGAEIVSACKKLTSVKDSRWAMASPLNIVTMFAMMNGSPNVWGEDGGKFTNAYETDAAKAALATVTQMWKDGVFYPDSFASGVSWRSLFGAGKIALAWAASDPDLMQQQFASESPGYELKRIMPPKWDGGGTAPYPLDPPASGFTAIPKQSSSKADQLLRVLDYLAAPFGTEEYLFLGYGVPTRDYTLNNGNPVLTKEGQQEVNPLQLRNISAPAWVLYNFQYPDLLHDTWELENSIDSIAVQDASIGLYSSTLLAKDTVLTKNITQAQTDIVQGRKSLASWDDVVKAWRSDGGDNIRAELEQSYAQSNGG